MELQLVSTEVAILAKELGLDWKCSTVINYNPPRNSIGTYSYVSNSEITEKYQYTLPEQELLAKWLRDVHKLFVSITNTNVPIKDRWVAEVGKLPKGMLLLWTTDSISYNTYEEAMEVGLLYALNYIKDNVD